MVFAPDKVSSDRVLFWVMPVTLLPRLPLMVNGLLAAVVSLVIPPVILIEPDMLVVPAVSDLSIILPVPVMLPEMFKFCAAPLL